MKQLKICCAILIMGYSNEPDDTIDGKWLMHRVIQDGLDVTDEHDPYNERFFLIHADSTFESGGRPYGKNTGKYVYDTASGTLFLDSDAGPDDDSNWKISVNGDTMKWQGYGSEWADRFQLVHVNTAN